MTLSNETEAARRFWAKYRNLLKKSGVHERALDWLVRHAEAYLEHLQGRRLVHQSVAGVEAWLADRGRIGGMQAWQFAQVVDAVRYLFVLIESPVASQVDWRYWREAATTLAPDHPSVARQQGVVKAASSAAGAEGGEYADPLARLIAVIRQRNYSIRTEQAYRGWVEQRRSRVRSRLVSFISFAYPSTHGPTAPHRIPWRALSRHVAR